MWLTSAEAAAAIAGVDPTADSLAANRDLRRQGFTAEQAAAILTQAELRHRASPRLGPMAEKLLLTRDGLEQASRPAIAAARARRIASRRVLDAGCGLGLDSIALARAGHEVIAVEQDPTTAEFARANFAATNVPVVLLVGDVREIAGQYPGAALYVDPARRRAARSASGQSARIADPEQWQPPLSWVVEQSQHREVVARLGPGLRNRPPGLWHCTSVDGVLVDATLYFTGQGARATVMRRGALVLDIEGPCVPAPVGEVGASLHDPDPAIVRAGLVADFAAAIGGWLVDEHLALVSSDRPDAPAAVNYRVRERIRYDRLRQTCRRLSITSATVVTKGFATDTRSVLRAAGIREGGQATLIVTREGVGRRTTLVYVCDRA